MTMPAVLGRYLLERELGRGSMGVVYLARDPRIDRAIALKTLSADVAAGPSAPAVKERFLNEGRAAGRLNHRGIVAVYDADEDAATGVAYLAMEFVEGRDLKALMRDGLSLDRLVELLAEVGEALDHAHARGVIHRDVKPANIIVDAEGHARLTDFGIARLASSTMTQAGEFLGTPAYMAPEQVLSKPVGPATDVFALGVILYEGLTRRRPFEGDSMVSTTLAIAHAEPDRPSLAVPGLPRGLDAVVSRALAKDPANRFASAGELMRAVRHALSAGASAMDETLAGRPLAATAATAQAQVPVDDGRKRKPRTFVVATIGLLAVVVIAIVAILFQSREDEPLAEGASASSAAPADKTAATASAPAARAAATGRIRVTLSSMHSGTLVIREGSRVLGRVTIAENKGKGLRALKKVARKASATLDAPAGSRLLALTFDGDGQGNVISARSAVLVSEGSTVALDVEVGPLGRDLDVKVR